MATSQLLHQITGEDSTQDVFSYTPNGQNSIEDAPSDVESGHISYLQSYESEISCCNILASGKLFRLITKATGLWNPRQKHYTLLCAIFVVLNILSLLAEILIPSICGPFVDRCVTHSKRVTNLTENDNRSVEIIARIYETTLAFDAWNAFSDTMTYILLIYTLWRAQKHFPLLSLSSAHGKVTSYEWLLINMMLIICLLAIAVASVFRISVVESSKMKFYGTFGLGVLIVYLTAFTCCCAFAVLTCSLGRLTDLCFQKICNIGEGNLNDVTEIHQKLCKQLFATSQSLKPWFLVHWVLFGVNCLAVFAFDSMYFGLLTRQFNGAPTVFMAISFVLNFAIFLVPCIYASRVTWKCEDMLSKINNMSSGEWNEGHPFRERVNVNEFIFYAERSKCGFKIGKMTFGSSGTWISAFLGLLGLGVKLIDYIK